MGDCGVFCETGSALCVGAKLSVVGFDINLKIFKTESTFLYHWRYK